MAFDDWTEFPRRIIRADSISNSTVTVSTTPIKVSGILITEQDFQGGSARFRNVGGTTPHFIVLFSKNESIYYPIHAEFEDLEVYTGSPADVDIIFFTCSDTLGTTVV